MMKVPFHTSKTIEPGDYILHINYPRRIRIRQVIYNDPATIVLWADGTKTVVKCENESYDKEKGLAIAIAKKALGNRGAYYDVFRQWLKEEGRQDNKTDDMQIDRKCIKEENKNDRTPTV